MMAVLEIQLTSQAQAFQTELNGVQVVMHIAFARRYNRWHCTVFSVDGMNITQTMPLVTGANLLQSYGSKYGALYMLDFTGLGLDAGEDSLGDTVRMFTSTTEEYTESFPLDSLGSMELLNGGI